MRDIVYMGSLGYSLKHPDGSLKSRSEFKRELEEEYCMLTGVFWWKVNLDKYVPVPELKWCDALYRRQQFFWELFGTPTLEDLCN